MVEFGVGFAPVEPMEKVIRYAELCEDWGYSHFALFDQRLEGEKDAYVALTACALNTEKMTLGPLVSDPYSRFPSMTAVAIATIDEISGGRAILGYGAGSSGFRRMGIKRIKPAKAIRDGVYMMRNLLAGKTVTYESIIQRNSLVEAGLGFKSRQVPIYIATRSPKAFQVAGEMAEGAVIGSYGTVEGIKYALENIEKGAKRADRDMKDIDLVSWVYVSVSRDREEALENVKPVAIYSVSNTSPEAYPRVGVDEEEIEPIKEIFKDGYNPRTMKKAAKFISEKLLDKFSVAGTADDCVKKIKRIIDCGVNKVWIWPFSAPSSLSNVDEVLKPFAEEVMSQFS